MLTDATGVSSRDDQGPEGFTTWSIHDSTPSSLDGAVVAVVPARNSAAAEVTVRALLDSGKVDHVVLVDDGSTDDTADRAARAGATVLRVPTNVGKGAAVALGRLLAPNAEIYLLVDADLGTTAGAATALLAPVRAGDADLAVAVFPPAAGRGGFGIIKQGSARIIRALCGLEVAEPLSGQRAIRGELFGALVPAPRFGLEVAMTIDAVRSGARVVEIPLPLDHEHSGRSLAGFRHRARQGLDIIRATVPRLGNAVIRRLAIVGAAISVLVIALTLAEGNDAPRAIPSSDRPVVLITLASAALSDLGNATLPALEDLAAGTGGSMAPRTPSVPSDQASGYATAGAGAPVVLVPPGMEDMELEETAGLLGLDDETVGSVPFVGIVPGPSGTQVSTSLVTSTDTRSYGTRGALGDALRSAGVSTAYVGARSGSTDGAAPGALVIADSTGRVDHAFEGSLPLTPTDDLDARVEERVAALRAAIDVAGVVVVDAGGAPLARSDVDRRRTQIDSAQVQRRRVDQLVVADQLLAAVAAAELDARIIIVGLAPPPPWRLTPTAGIGLPGGAMWSASTRQPGISVLTDVAPTVLSLRGLEIPDDMVGRPIGIGPEAADQAQLTELATRSEARDRLYVPAIMTFVILQGLVYLTALWALRRRRSGDPAGQLWLSRIERVVVGFTAFPVATFLWRALPASVQEPWIAGVGFFGMTVIIAALALRCRRHPMSPLVAISGLTVGVLLIDAATSGALQRLSLLGYTPVTAARFYGIGNMGFAVVGATSVLLAGAWVALSPNRRDGLVAAACLLAVVTVAEVAPSLGADFGGVLTFVPVFGAILTVWAGVRFSWARLAMGVLAAVAVSGAITWWEVRSGGETHLGRFVDGGIPEMREVIVRKATTNLRVMRITFWTWMVPIIFVFIVGSLTAGDGWRRWFGQDRVWRATFVGMIVFGVVGGLVNDSGIVIPALALVYVGAFLLLVQSRQPFGPYLLRVADAETSTAGRSDP